MKEELTKEKKLMEELQEDKNKLERDLIKYVEKKPVFNEEYRTIKQDKVITEALAVRVNELDVFRYK